MVKRATKHQNKFFSAQLSEDEQDPPTGKTIKSQYNTSDYQQYYLDTDEREAQPRNMKASKQMERHSHKSAQVKTQATSFAHIPIPKQRDIEQARTGIRDTVSEDNY
jgi:Tfp pilus assembly protein PilE